MAIRLTLRSIPLLAVGAYLAACGNAGPASASDCDVVAARDGSDRAAGTVEAPLKTAQEVIDRLKPGQTGCLREGTYAETPNGPHVLQFQHGGRDGAPLTLRSYPGERAKLVGLIWVEKGSDHVTLSNLEIDGRGKESGGSVTLQLFARNTILEDSDITNRRLRSCVIVGSNDGHGAARDVIIRRNVFRDCGSPENGNHDHGIYVQNLTGGEITGNVFYGTSAWAVQLYPNANRVRVTRNVMDDNYGGVVVASSDGETSSNNVIERNIITRSGDGQPAKTSWGGPEGVGNVMRGNCVDRSGGGLRPDEGLRLVGNTVVADAGFVDRGARDYRLAPDSPCRDVVGGDPAAELRETSSVASAALPVAKPRTSCRRAKTRRARLRCIRAARARATA